MRINTRAALLLASLSISGASGADWPMWRYDATRCGASPQQLAEKLHLQWVRELPPQPRAWMEPVNRHRMPYDRCYEPIVMGRTLVFGSARNDAVIGLDTRTGSEKWRFYTNGPVRLPPAALGEKVYAVSDDGCLYCLEIETGKLVWKFRGGPSERKVLGNERLISMWPARGGPVIADGAVYFAAGIWPFMGVFVHALDAESGKVIWTNDGSAPRFMMQIKRGPAFDGPAPQGAIVAVGDRLLVPCGRSVPACFDRRTGELIYFHTEGYAGGKPVFNTETNRFDVILGDGERLMFYGNNYRRLRYAGGSNVYALGRYFFNSMFAFDVACGGDLMWFPPKIQTAWSGKGEEPSTTYVLTEDVIYASGAAARAYDAKSFRPVSAEAEKALHGRRQKAMPQWQIDMLWTTETDRSTWNSSTLTKAGSRLYVGTQVRVSALELDGSNTPPKVSWRATVHSKPLSLVAADDRLFVATQEGNILCYGPDPLPVRHFPHAERSSRPEEEWTKEARAILDQSGVREGYCLALGLGTGGLAQALVRESDLRVVVFERDAAKADAARRKLDAQGLYGSRLSIVIGDLKRTTLPPYLASLIVSEDSAIADLGSGAELVEKVFHSLRPFGGAACLALRGRERSAFKKGAEQSGLANAKVRSAGRYVLLSREGALPGSANWTHPYCSASKSNLSADERVRLPLGLLWFGGSSHDEVLPRHGCGPVPQVVDGRLFHEGPNGMRATDIYTGRILWNASLPGLGLAYDCTHHQPVVRASGGNYASVPDGVYIAYGKRIVRLDPATGRRVSEFPLPAACDGEERLWGPVTVWKDLLVASVTGRTSRKRLSGHDRFVYFSSEELVALDRNTGKLLWRFEGSFSHLASAVGGGRVYCVFGPSPNEVRVAERRGEKVTTRPKLVALDARTGEQLWASEDRVGSWLSYSEKRDILLVAAANSAVALKGTDGSVIWTGRGGGTLLIRGDTLISPSSRRPVALDLLTGEPATRTNPLTGKEMPFRFVIPAETGCSEIIGGRNILTFRACSAGYFDLVDGGSGNFGGFRASCTTNLVPAGGLLNAPDYTRTCLCMYQNQCSLALVHMPEVETWCEFDYAAGTDPVQRVGINFGAPGDRLAEDGTLWLDHPSVGGRSPDISVTVEPANVRYFRRHSLTLQGNGLKWVAGSGCEGVSRVTLTLVPGDEPGQGRTYTVRLHFAEMGAAKLGERVFSVSLQGKTALKELDVVSAAGGPKRPVVKEFKVAPVKNTLTIEFASVKGGKEFPPVICGIEAVRSTE